MMWMFQSHLWLSRADCQDQQKLCFENFAGGMILTLTLNRLLLDHLAHVLSTAKRQKVTDQHTVRSVYIYFRSGSFSISQENE